MRISVWDTYVARNDETLMHFDILVSEHLNDEAKIFGFGNQYLGTKPFKTGILSAKECRFCHIEEAPDRIVTEIEEKGYAIFEMENCD